MSLFGQRRSLVIREDREARDPGEWADRPMKIEIIGYSADEVERLLSTLSTHHATLGRLLRGNG